MATQRKRFHTRTRWSTAHVSYGTTAHSLLFGGLRCNRHGSSFSLSIEHIQFVVNSYWLVVLFVMQHVACVCVRACAWSCRWYQTDYRMRDGVGIPLYYRCFFRVNSENGVLILFVTGSKKRGASCKTSTILNDFRLLMGRHDSISTMSPGRRESASSCTRYVFLFLRTCGRVVGPTSATD
jgi:hypothetical protein